MFEQRMAALPLCGKRVLVTRTREQASVLSERLRALGAIPVEFPTIRIVPPRDWGPLDTALRRLCEGGEPYDWLVFTSANGVRICLERLHILGYDALALCNVRIATIGPATAAALAHSGITADLVPHEYIAEGVVAALMQDAQQRGISLAGQRILLARAAEARKVLLTALQQAGALVDEVAAYDTQAVTHNDEQGCKVLALLQSQQIHILTFTSSSTVRNFVAWLKNCERAITDCKRVTIASIGPITSQTARELGLQVHIEAKEFTIEGLLEAIVRHEG